MDLQPPKDQPAASILGAEGVREWVEKRSGVVNVLWAGGGWRGLSVLLRGGGQQPLLPNPNHSSRARQPHTGLLGSVPAQTQAYCQGAQLATQRHYPEEPPAVVSVATGFSGCHFCATGALRQLQN